VFFEKRRVHGCRLQADPETDPDWRYLTLRSTGQAIRSGDQRHRRRKTSEEMNMDDEVLAALEQVNKRLDYVEDHILSMSKAGSRLIFVPMGRSSENPKAPSNAPAEVIELAHAGKRMDAIKKYRELTGAGPQEAIAAVDSL
jgi:hypothetical protein